MFPSFIFEIERPTGMPVWQDCVWIRGRCGACNFCKRLVDIERNYSNVAGNENFESEEVPASEGFDLSASRHFENSGSTSLFGATEPETPDVNTSPLFNEVKNWHRGLYECLRKSSGSLMNKELEKDLSWYGNLLVVKTGRILRDRFELDETDEPAELDYQYTRYVLARCLVNIFNAFVLLQNFDSSAPAELSSLFDQFNRIAVRIMKI